MYKKDRLDYRLDPYLPKRTIDHYVEKGLYLGEPFNVLTWSLG